MYISTTKMLKRKGKTANPKKNLKNISKKNTNIIKAKNNNFIKPSFSKSFASSLIINSKNSSILNQQQRSNTTKASKDDDVAVVQEQPTKQKDKKERGLGVFRNNPFLSSYPSPFSHPFFSRTSNYDPFDSFFEELDQRLPTKVFQTTKHDFMPSVDVSEVDDKMIVQTELPGMKKEDVNVKVENGYLEISGKKNQENKYEDKDKNYVSVERSYGSFLRRLTVPESIEIKDIKAKYDNGVLTISLPKNAEKEKTSNTIDIE